MNNEVSNLQNELRQGKPVIIFTTGTSMEPLLHDKSRKDATHVLVCPLKERLKLWDMPMVLLEDGKYMIHRIVGFEGEGDNLRYITRGDNCIGCEKVSPNRVLGIVREIYGAKKTVKVTDPEYLRYVKWRVKMFPFRKIWTKCIQFGAKIKRKFK